MSDRPKWVNIPEVCRSAVGALNNGVTLLETQDTPQVSVVIPAYNQAHFLTDAIRSVLAQSFDDYEVIVVDDGSTDETPGLAGQFGDSIRYVRQENQGLAVARNTGIHLSRGALIALLDSDDLWLPDYLETMTRLALNAPDAALYYCGAQYVDLEGRPLPQKLEAKLLPPDQFYGALLRADFLIPSTVTMRRSTVIAAGLFDPALRSQEDWDFWLRLAREYVFVGTPECLVHYRLHGSSLSLDLSGMQRAALSVVEKHFGPDDGRYRDWPDEKRRAYGGVHCYRAWTSVLRNNDWAACTSHVRQALRVDPRLAEDLELFYGLAMGSQPLGYRGTAIDLNLLQNAFNLERTIQAVFETDGGDLVRLRNRTLGVASYAIGLLAYNTGQYSACRRYMIKALRWDVTLRHDRQVFGTLQKAFLAPVIGEPVRWMRHRMRRFPTTARS